MKRILITALLAASSQTTICMQKTNALLDEISRSVTAVNNLVRPIKSSPKYLDVLERTIALRELAEIQAKSKMLAAVLADQDGWTTEESEK